MTNEEILLTPPYLIRYLDGIREGLLRTVLEAVEGSDARGRFENMLTRCNFTRLKISHHGRLLRINDCQFKRETLDKIESDLQCSIEIKPQLCT